MTVPQRPISKAALWCAALLAIALATVSGHAQQPRFTKDKELIRPTGFREWIFVGASLGMSYQEGEAKPDHATFHNIYIQPSAYREYNKTGSFPEGTILAMEVFTPTSQASINRQGQFEDRAVGFEAAVKDSTRFPETWAYFSFTLPEGRLADKAAAFPKDRCWSCHNEHAQTDNVFTQFYPVLRRGK